MKRVAVLASGRGSNVGALLGAQSVLSSYRVVLVLSNVPGAGALEVAGREGIESLTLPSKGLPRPVHEEMILAAIRDRSVDVLCLAGYMRIIGPEFIRDIGIPVLNVHPSLLPAFPGLRAQRQAIEAGVRWSGATVHFVDTGLDSGPIIVQEPVPVECDDTEETLSRRILAVEHSLYPQALNIVALNRYEVRGRTVCILDRASERPPESGGAIGP